MLIECLMEQTTVESVNGKRVKVIITDIIKQSAACSTCKQRKKKCDGKIPCSYISFTLFIPLVL